jgi:hypothetical protein
MNQNALERSVGDRRLPQAHKLRALFSVPFRSPMTIADLGQLQHNLDLTTYITPKPGVSGGQPGVVPLDFWSGLFLQRGASDAEWVLEGRTWGHPPEEVVHEWYVRTALAARQLDSTVEIPPRPAAATPSLPSRPVGRAANKRLARLGRHLLGLE